jgi:cytochrome c-type biogenesis protein CcmH
VIQRRSPRRHLRMPASLRVALITLTAAAVTVAAGAASSQPAPAAPQEAVGAAAVYDEELEARTREVAALLRCPVCQGESIQDSPADLAREMRAVVRDQLAAGRTPDEVKAYFVDRYGEWILLAPPARGFNLLLYVLPFAGLAIGGGALFVAARRWQRHGSTAAHVSAPDEDEY